ncbi:type II secretion system protein [Anaerosporobacter sp.]
MEKRQEAIQNGRKKLGNKGFSLVELIVVIAIMAILTVVIAPQFMRYIEKSRESMDKQTIESINSSIQAALADEKAWNALGDAEVTITFDNKGGSVVVDGNGDVTSAADRKYSSGDTDFSKEVNRNLNKTVSFKSKKLKDGVIFTITTTKEVKNDGTDKLK